jgi:carboxyl-terminal processing protease
MEGWKSAELNAIQSVQDTGPEDDEIVNSAITTMLSKLNDPYTRFLPRDKYETLTAYATGTSVGGGGIGIQLLEDVRSKNVMVMAVTENGPAAKAGLQIGDFIVGIDGETMEGASAEVVAAKCRGEVGQKLEMDFLRVQDNGKSDRQHVTLSRAKIVQNPVRASTFETGNKKIGQLRIPSFSTETVSQMVEGLRSISDSKVDAIVIDLRGNVGGYMPAGVDAAKLFLPKQSKIITEVDKTGISKVYSADGIGSETSVPLYILVDKRTASASEIFVAGLQDNKRAVIVGTSNTFGKGRIQNVKALENGSGMAVTRARYVTPLGRDIHGVGVTPDKTPNQCEANDSAKTCLADVLDL